MPIDTGLDEDADTDAAASPYIVVLLEGGKIYNPQDAKVVSATLTVCCYDEGHERDGFRDVQNILEAIEQHFCVKPFFGGAAAEIPHIYQRAGQQGGETERQQGKSTSITLKMRCKWTTHGRTILAR